jgi:hypothetical protein
VENLIAACNGGDFAAAAEDTIDTVLLTNGFRGGAAATLDGSGAMTPQRRALPGRLQLLLGRAESTPNRSSSSNRSLLFGAGGVDGGGGGGGGREEARPSPERLDAQIRSLTVTQVLQYS